MSSFRKTTLENEKTSLKVEKEDAAKLGKTTNDSRKLVKGIVQQQAPNRREPDRPISEAVCGGNEEAAQVALFAVILDRMGCLGATVERMVSALLVDTGEKMKDEEVYASIYSGQGLLSDGLGCFLGIGSSPSPHHRLYVACQSSGSLGLQASQRATG